MQPLGPNVTGERTSAPVRIDGDVGKDLGRRLSACEPGAVVELAPGVYEGPICITQPITLRGAGELTRIIGLRGGSVEVCDCDQVYLESIRLEGGEAQRGGGLQVRRSSVVIRNLHIEHSRAIEGGAIAVVDGKVRIESLRVSDVEAARGGAIFVQGVSELVIHDALVTRASADYGGAVSLRGACSLELRNSSIGKVRALKASGGQAIHLEAGDDGVPSLTLHAVRLEDAPLGAPVVSTGTGIPVIRVSHCDLPRLLRRLPGVIENGENHWR
jgi:hypothetical protein